MSPVYSSHFIRMKSLTAAEKHLDGLLSEMILNEAACYKWDCLGGCWLLQWTVQLLSTTALRDQTNAESAGFFFAVGGKDASGGSFFWCSRFNELRLHLRHRGSKSPTQVITPPADAEKPETRCCEGQTQPEKSVLNMSHEGTRFNSGLTFKQQSNNINLI